jgi:subtilisin family serine protease
MTDRPRNSTFRRLAWAGVLAVLALGAASPAAAQLLGGHGPLGLPVPDLPDLSRDLPDAAKVVPQVGRTVDRTAGAAAGAVDTPLSELRRLRAQDLIRRYPDRVEADDRGEPVVRGEILAVAATPAALAQARGAGYRVRHETGLEGVGLDVSVLTAPRGLSAVEAVRRLRALDPAGQYDFNHLYLESGAVGAGAGQERAAGGETGAAARIGLVDGGTAKHPSLARARIVQRGFAPGGLKPSAHGTAVASLLAGRQGRFRGAAPGASLYVADVYGESPVGGSAAILAQAFAWMVANAVPVVNVSLVGPPNLVLAAAARALTARGVLLVAAVGNDGPAAPPLYPAAYPGVIAVTAVDGRRRLLPEASRGAHVDFAAPGSDMAAAAAQGGYAPVRGTSFAAPLVAGRLALLMNSPDPAAAARAIAALARDAEDLGAPGPDPIYGRGLVAFDLRMEPALVKAGGAALRGP